MIRPIGVVGGNCALPSTHSARRTSDDSTGCPDWLGESKHLALGGSKVARGDWGDRPMDDSGAETEATNSITLKPRHRTSAVLGLFVLQTIMRQARKVVEKW